MIFPNLNGIDPLKDKDTAKKVIDYAISMRDQSGNDLSRINKLYNHYSDKETLAERALYEKPYGKQSKVKFKRYKIGRSKLKLLHGEFLQFGLTSTVNSVNPDVVSQKMLKYAKLLGLSHLKDDIEEMRSVGLNVMDGVNIPDKNDKGAFDINNFKTDNEICFQNILDEKIRKTNIRSEFKQNFVDATIAAQMHGKIEKMEDGKYGYRRISPRLALYPQDMSEGILNRAPYLGELRYMYAHEVLAEFEQEIQKQDSQSIKDYMLGYTSSYEGLVGNGNDLLFPVYTVQFKVRKPYKYKTDSRKYNDVDYINQISDEYYDKNKSQIESDVKLGKYKVDTYYNEELYTISRISTNVYTRCKRVQDTAATFGENKKINVKYDYIFGFSDNVDGVKLSIQEIIIELEKEWDSIRFKINKELSKLRGAVMFYDLAYLPNTKLGGLSDVLHDIDNDGIATYNSAAEFNMANKEGQGATGITMQQLGSDSTLGTLMNLALDIERTMDMITGVTKDRQGDTPATMTATTNSNNLQASRSMTYDLFYFANLFMQESCLRLIQKTKLSPEPYQNQFILDDNQLRLLNVTKDVMLDDLGVYLSDGKQEQEIRQEVRNYFPAELNSGMLRSSDIIKFNMKTNLKEALRVLEKAHDEIHKLGMDAEKEKTKRSEMENKNMLEMAREDREDRQQHEIELQTLKLKGSQDLNTQKSMVQAAMQDGKAEQEANINKQQINQ